MAGLCFKASVAPFHQWTPDVYEGAPTPVTAFMAVATKVAALGVFLRFFDVALIEAHASWGPALAALATITIIVGNVGALGQSSLKRMLAYSSVAQAGYMLAGVVVATQLGVQATVFYLAVYLFMNMAAFAVIVARERETGLGDSIARDRGPRPRAPAAGMADDDLDAGPRRDPRHRGLHRQVLLDRRRRLGRLHVAGVVIVIGSMISLGYYLPVIAAMWMSEAPAERRRRRAARPPRRAAPRRGRAAERSRGGSPELDDAGAPPTRAPRPAPQPEVALVALLAGAATIFFGIIPQPLFNLVHGVGSALGLL